ncbi:MAG: hypothetical protein JAY95_11690 [Candidatus Thiodiazotropha taylori]|nr:hypothetical protein [Candidatus Thiodiazotropha taylori]
MPPIKTATLYLCIDPILKEASQEGFHLEQRSDDNMVVLIRKHCDEVGIQFHEKQSPFK